ncbi:hypothetical protein [Streptomyces sp. KL116D]|uniref:hypothetical protein n=1 Tax=Streptomyces sp. KL116D TaxID=3045152 RepID=UPI003559038A
MITPALPLSSRPRDASMTPWAPAARDGAFRAGRCVVLALHRDVRRHVVLISADVQAVEHLAQARQLPDLDDRIAGCELPAARAEPLREALAA